MPQPPRFIFRSRVLRDARLEHGAKVLYLLLDDLAMGTNFYRWTHHSMGAALGAGRRTVQRWVLQLNLGGYLQVHRTGRSSVYAFGWADASPMAHHDPARCVTGGASDASPMAHHEGRIKSIGTQDKQGGDDMGETPDPLLRETMILVGQHPRNPKRQRELWDEYRRKKQAS